MIKKTLFLTIFTLITALLLASCAPAQVSNNESELRQINVRGEGVIELEPEIARVNMGVRTQSEQIDEAISENNTIIAGIIQSLSAMGIEERDIQTHSFNVYPQQMDRPLREEVPVPEAEPDEMPMPEVEPDEEFTPDEAEPEEIPEPEASPEEVQVTEDVTIQSFVVENTIRVVVRDFDSLGEILATALAEGANTIHGISFDIENREQVVEEARQIAIQNAQNQAESIAEAAGITLGPIQSISVDRIGAPGVRPEVAMDRAEAMDVPIAGGVISIVVNVDITYQID